jgi:hypothetical protein
MAKKKVSKKKSYKVERRSQSRKKQPVKITVDLSRGQAGALRKFARICGDGDLSAALKKIAMSFEE